MAGHTIPLTAVPEKPLRWKRADLYAVVGLIAFWVFKASKIFGDFAHRHFAMRLSVPDVMEQQWNTYWLGRAITNVAESIHYSPLINYPVGADYFGARPNYVHCMAAGWVQMKWAGVPAANVVALSAILFSLLTFYILFRHLAGSRAIGFVLAILVASFSLLFDNQLLDISLCNAGFLALSLHFWLRAVGNPGWRLGLTAVFFAVLTGVSHLYYEAMFIGFLGLALPFMAFGEFRSGKTPRRVTAYSAGVLLATAFIVAFVLWGPMATIRAVSAEGGVTPQLVARQLRRHTLLMTCLAIAGLVGATWALRGRRGRGVWFWLLCTVLLHLFSLGDRSLARIVHHEGVPPGGLPLSWLLSIVPFGWRFTQPDRLVVGTLISAGCLAGVLWRGLAAQKIPFPVVGTRLGKGVVFVAGLYLLLPHLGVSTPYRLPGAVHQATTSAGRSLTTMRDSTAAYPICQRGIDRGSLRLAREPVYERYLWPLLPLEYFVPPGVPKVLADLADDPEPMAIMEVGGDVHFLSLYYQTIHGKGVGGYHLPPHLRSAHPPSPLTLAQEEIREHRSYDSLSLPRLRELGVRYVIRLRSDDPEPGPGLCPDPVKVAEALAALNAPHLRLVHEDNIVQVWKVDTDDDAP